MRHARERQRERDDSAAVHGGGDAVGIHHRRDRNLVADRVLARMLDEPVALDRPAFGLAERDEPGVLARAVVLDPRRFGAALEVLFGGTRFGKEAADRIELLRSREM